MQRDFLVSHLNELLQIRKFRDYAPNGLQIAGRAEIQTVVTTVSASQAAIDFAVANNADALLVHHGYFWKGEAAELVGVKRKRIATLLHHEINLLAYHLPLDQHATLGNNALFGQALSAHNIRQSSFDDFLWQGDIETVSASQWIAAVEKILQRSIIAVGNTQKMIQKIAWCTGAAQDLLLQAHAEGADAFLTGEYAERSYHEARECDMLFLVCGHHSTETFGVRALGDYLAATQGLKIFFFDEDNPF